MQPEVHIGTYYKITHIRVISSNHTNMCYSIGARREKARYGKTVKRLWFLAGTGRKARQMDTAKGILKEAEEIAKRRMK